MVPVDVLHVCMLGILTLMLEIVKLCYNKNTRLSLAKIGRKCYDS